MMALNVAVPMSGVGDLLDVFGLLSPISPVNIDFRNSIKNPLSPVGSESSGVSSLDLEDIKKQMPTLMDENEESVGSSGAGKSPTDTTVGLTMSSVTSSRTCSTSSSSSTTSDDYTNQLEENEQKSSDGSSSNDDDVDGAATAAAPPPSLTSPDLLGSDVMEPEKEPAVTGKDGTSPYTEEVRRSLDLMQEINKLPLLLPKALNEPNFSVPRTSIYYYNRDILDLGSNIRPQGTTAGEFAFQFAELPETNNIQFFLQNRSQYHRLGPNGFLQEYRMETCRDCDFQYPVNIVGANSYAAPGFGTTKLANLNENQIYGSLQQQQQQQQHQQQMRLQQQQLQMQYANRYNNNVNGNAMGRDYNMYHQQQAASGMGGGAAGAGPQSSRFNNGVYGGSANVLPGGAHNVLGGSTAANGGYFNNNLYNPMASGMGMQYNNAGATPKGISQSNGGTLAQPTGHLRQQQQYDMFQQQKQYLNNYAGLGTAAGNNGVNVTASSNTAAVRLQQQQQAQHASHYYKKPQTIRYGGAGVNNTMPSSAGPSTGSNWKSPMANSNAMQDPAAKQLFMELNKMQQQQQSQYYVPFQ
ncbi:serine/threonine-protein kinase pakD-like [Anopheles maculipalpis]|uniref:serine/threonine-protein kinase pakD-like n=1 Tax=Anopheles maculipalpis TaxID=1496333 RepID=UPI0021590FC1|nr:serine/threonine-protein kinase pakD-like [Anopheles maculipalpis]